MGLMTDNSLQFVPCLEVKLFVCLGKDSTIHVIELEWQAAGVYILCWHHGLIVQPLDVGPMKEVIFCKGTCIASHRRVIKSPIAYR